jgi:hypothetical protein
VSVQDVLSCCDKVKKTGPDSWVACCPAHKDRTPSMAIRELSDGTVLLHDFGGCSVIQILDACGLSFDDLYPPKPIEDRGKQRRTFPAVAVLEAVGREAMVIAILAQGIADGKVPTPEDLQRAHLANARIQDAVGLVR